MLVIGLTGGIGAGKSLVSDFFSCHHVPIIDTDLLAREGTEQGHPILNQLRAHFGDHILLTDGELNRKKLREIIFTSPEEKKWLESLLHPFIRNRVQEELRKLSFPYCIVVIPLLAETDSYDFLDRILVVDALPERQIERVKNRDHIPLPLVQAMLNEQASREDRLALADDIITNNGAKEDVRLAVEKLHHVYMQMASTHESHLPRN